MCYSTDLREKVIEFVESRGSATEGASIFGISRRTIYYWIKKKKTTGSVKDMSPRRPWRKLDPDTLIEYVREHPDCTLKEYAQHFNTIPSTICEAFKRLRITRKERLYGTKRGMRKSAQHSWKRYSGLSLK